HTRAAWKEARGEGGTRHGGRAVGEREQAGEAAQAGPEPAGDGLSPHGREGRGLLGDELQLGVRLRDGASRQGLRDRRHQGRRRQEELPLPERHHARLRDAGADGRLHVRQPPGQVELRLWNLVFGVAGPGAPSTTGPAEGPFVFWWPGNAYERLLSGVRVGAPARGRPDRSAAALLRALAAV